MQGMLAEERKSREETLQEDQLLLGRVWALELEVARGSFWS